MEEHILSPILEAIPQIIEIVGATHQLQLYSPNASGPKHLEKDAHCVEPGTRICAKCTIARVIFTVERACILCVGACMHACVCARVCGCACVCARVHPCCTCVLVCVRVCTTHPYFDDGHIAKEMRSNI